MLNEGLLNNSMKTLIKTEMIRQLRRLQQTTPETWERRVFESLTGQSREDVDWELEDNQAGYYTWVKSFDALIEELMADGYVRVEKNDDDSRTLHAVVADPPVDFSHLVYRTQ